MILTREQVEARKPDDDYEKDYKETALALYDENERLKEMVCSPIDFNHWKKDIEVKGESLMKQYIDATYRVKELEAENARLREENKKLLDANMESFNHRRDMVEEVETLRAIVAKCLCSEGG